MLIGLTPANTFGFRLLFLLHIVAVVVAFAPVFVGPFLGRQQRTTSATSVDDAPTTAATPAMTRLMSPLVHGGALVLAGLFGMGLVGASSDSIKMSQTWISIAFLLWFLMLALFFLGLLPTEKRLVGEGARAGDHASGHSQRLAMLYGGMHLLFLLQVINMVWQLK